MNVKKFLLKIESGANTRWLMDDKQLIERIHFYADTLARIHTAGTEPAVLVTSEESPSPLPADEHKTTCPKPLRAGGNSKRATAAYAEGFGNSIRADG